MYWDKAKHPKFEASIKALVYDDQDRLLFAQDEHGKWDLPGGRIDEGEGLEVCLRREVREELGVDLKEIVGLQYAEIIDYDDKERRISIGYKVVLESTNFIPSNENIENKFFTKNEFEAMNQAYKGLKQLKDKLFK